MGYSYDRTAGVPESLTHRLSPSEVKRLPVGSIVWTWVRDRHSGPMGRVDGGPLIVIPGGDITPISNLPERADGEEPGGEDARKFGREFLVVNKGRGKLPTHGTAQRLAINWQRKNPDYGRMASTDRTAGIQQDVRRVMDSRQEMTSALTELSEMLSRVAFPPGLPKPPLTDESRAATEAHNDLTKVINSYGKFSDDLRRWYLHHKGSLRSLG